MIGANPALSPAQRDAGLRRTRLANRGLVGAMIALTAVLAEFAAKAFPGHARRIVPAAAVVHHLPRTHRAPASSAGPGRGRHHSRHRSRPAALKPPAQAPISSPATSAPSAPAPAAPVPAAAPAPAPAPASAPAVSGGS